MEGGGEGGRMEIREVNIVTGVAGHISYLRTSKNICNRLLGSI